MRSACCLASILLGVVAGFAACLAPASAQEKEHPIVTAVKANVKDATKPFTMLVHIKIKDGAAAKFEAAFARAITETRKEKGALAYDLNRSAKHPNEYVVYERWRNVAALEAHLKSPHIQALFAATGDRRDGMPEAKILVPVGE
jgi:quinol monooxygenase YgiN